jgi:phytoene/squalene synthetase
MNLYNQLEVPAMKLGSAFQKVNFLRDLNADIKELGRLYFPELVEKELNEDVKHLLVSAVEKDFETAYFGIKLLPKRSKLAVLIAYYYYRELLRRIQRKSVNELLSKRIHVPTSYKMYFFMKAAVDYKLKLV